MLDGRCRSAVWYRHRGYRAPGRKRKRKTVIYYRRETSHHNTDGRLWHIDINGLTQMVNRVTAATAGDSGTRPLRKRDRQIVSFLLDDVSMESIFSGAK